MAGLLNHGTIDTLGWDNSLLWGTALYILGSWVFSSLPGLHLLEAVSSCNNQKCFQTLSKVLWGKGAKVMLGI